MTWSDSVTYIDKHFQQKSINHEPTETIAIYDGI